jgi:hypothetical protein
VAASSARPAIPHIPGFKEKNKDIETGEKYWPKVGDAQRQQWFGLRQNRGLILTENQTEITNGLLVLH